MVIGRALSFTGEKPFRQERDELAQALAGSMNDLARPPDRIGVDQRGIFRYNTGDYINFRRMEHGIHTTNQLQRRAPPLGL